MVINEINVLLSAMAIFDEKHRKRSKSLFKAIVEHALPLTLACFYAGQNCAWAKDDTQESLQATYTVLALPSAVDFSVVMNKSVSTSSAITGDYVEALLKEDLIVDGLTVIPARSTVFGHVEKTQPGCRMGTSMRRDTRRFRNSATMSLIFDEIVTTNNVHLPIIGQISKQKIVEYKNTDHPRELKINKKGEFKKAEDILPTGKRRLSRIISIAVPAGAGQYAPGVMGALGAIAPSMVTGKPISLDDKHPRLHGMCKGFISNAPGGFIFASFVFKGSEIEIKEGDEFLIEAKPSRLPLKEAVMITTPGPTEVKQAQ